MSGTQLDLREPDVHGTRQAVGRLSGSRVSLEQSAGGIALGRDITLDRSAAVMLGGGKVVAERSAAQWLVGGLVQAKQVFAVTVIAAKVEGQVKCLFDTKGAFAFGAGLAVVGTALRLLFRR
ncbi:MAG TPA: hypothetical protein VFX49_14550 [Chloroflexota bacterium]|nr:hypothetical protein [Chloroflexota bacterium]